MPVIELPQVPVPMASLMGMDKEEKCIRLGIAEGIPFTSSNARRLIRSLSEPPDTACESGQSEAKFEEDSGQWEVLVELPFLDLSRSRFPYKSFYIPFLSSRHNVFDRYMILRNKKATIQVQPQGTSD